MKKGLVIAEKPSLMRTIRDVYEKHKNELPYELEFIAQQGHLLTLKLPSELDPEQAKWSFDHLPFFLTEHGGWQYKLITGTGIAAKAKEKYYDIRDELKSGDYDFIVHAGDPDQEGELLVDIVLQSLHNHLPVKRYWSNDNTEEKALEALKNLRDDDNDPMLINFKKAGYCRQHVDYLYGMNLSEAVSLQMGGRAAIGRVKTWLLGMVARREDEIKNFKPSTCYGIKASYADGFDGQMFDQKTIKPDKNDNDKDADAEEKQGYVYYDTEAEAKAVVDGLGRKAVVKDFQKKLVTTYAPKLFEMTGAQVAGGKLGYAIDETSSALQSLYEKGYLSYPRTDCEYLSSHENFHAMIDSCRAVPELVPYIDSINESGIQRVLKSKKYVNDKALTEHGHSALAPTTKSPNFASLSDTEKDIYTLVCRQFIAIFLDPQKSKKVTLVTEIDGHTFKSAGKEMVDEGYLKIFSTKTTDNIIPAYNIGDVIKVDSIDTVSKTTKCPGHLTGTDLAEMAREPHKFLEDESLKALGDKLHIGTSATRGPIIKQLVDKDKYLHIVARKGAKQGYLEPTDDGYRIYQNLKNEEMCKTDTTAQWELSLDKIRNGELDSREFEHDMEKHIARMVEKIRLTEMAQFAKANASKFNVLCTCPKCGSDIISGPNNFFCSGRKEKGCEIGLYKTILGAKITDDDFKALLEGHVIEKKLKKESSVWMQKLKYNVDEHKLEFAKDEIKKLEFKCPACKTEVEDTGRTVKCPGCGFTIWKSQCGHVLKDSEIEDLLTKGSTKTIKGLKSKKGTRFDAKIAINDDLTGTTFVFPDRKKK